jgi:hypothetical protein
MDKFKEFAWAALLYAAAITVGIVAAKLGHGIYTGTAAPTPPASTS